MKDPINSLRRQLLGIRTECEIKGVTTMTEFTSILQSLNDCEVTIQNLEHLLEHETALRRRIRRSLSIVVGDASIEDIEEMINGKPWKQWKSRLKLAKIADIVSRACGVTSDELINHRRYQRGVKAREVFCHVVYEVLDIATLETIGEFLSGRDHSTVVNSKKQYKIRFEMDAVFAELATKIIDACKMYAMQCRPNISMKEDAA